MDAVQRVVCALAILVIALTVTAGVSHSEDATTISETTRLLERLDAIENRLKSVEKLVKISHTHTANILSSAMEEIEDKLTDIDQSLRQNVGTWYTSCRGAPAGLSNTHMIRPKSADVLPFQVYCDQRLMDGGWIVALRRYNGELNFTRCWTEYKESFGELDGEHWLGLEKLHKITTSDSFELLVVLKDYEGVEKTALYEEFEVAAESDGYRLHLGKFVGGEATDSLRLSSGSMFSTYDRDNDSHPGSCAKFYESGWWFRNCMNANLNGVYRRNDERNITMNWFGFHNDFQGLKEVTMLIREQLSK